jgi:hypothetical protein
MRIRVPGLALLVLMAACSRGAQKAPSPSASASASAPPKGTLAIGERITQPLVQLTDIANNPDRYANRVVATSGTVTAVCQEMGCWMELRDSSGRAHVRMHGHTFFVPKTASGHLARVQATVLPSAPAADEDCAEGKTQVAKVQLDATGVELD